MSTEHAAWRSAADTIADLNFAQYRSFFIHETAQIRRFFAETRAEHFIISAPKGFGKTLLLIAKRMQLNEHSPELLDRGGEIVDRPAGSFREVSKNRLKEYKSDFELWRRIWTYSIMVAAINQHKRRIEPDIVPETQEAGNTRLAQMDLWTQEILTRRERYRSPTLIFTALLGLDYSSRQKALNSLPQVNTLFGEVQSQVAFFIDNVDEYFAPALENQSMTALVRNSADDQNKSNQIWINAQLALVVTAFQLHRVNHHLRVYCTVRREAFLQLHEQPAEYSQILGCTVEINYDRSDLRIMFEKNVKLMGRDSLFPDGGEDPIAKFFGPSAREMKHRLVERSQNAFDFLLRHTFYRPRDLMTICGRIALIAREDRTAARIKEVVDEESTHLVYGMFTEMKPFFRLPDLEILLPCIRKNTLTAADLELVRREYLRRMEEKAEERAEDWAEDYRHPFCVLYQIGMLGWIQPDPRNEAEDLQRFVKPREVEVGKSPGLPQTGTFYLIHPALDHMIAERVGRDYFRQFHRANIIGPDLPWTEPAASSFVVKGDVCGFSRVMGTEFYRDVVLKLHDWAKAACGDLDFVEISGGDSITMIDRSAEKLVECVFTLLERARLNREHPLTFRFGGSAGPITFELVDRRISSTWEKILLPLGQALRAGARLEPHAPKGKLIVDSQFYEAARTSNQLRMDELRPEDIPLLDYDSEGKLFLVQKSTTDPAHPTRLYMVNSQ